jgi:hypothetical protein
MFIGWIRTKSFNEDLELFGSSFTIDKSLVSKTLEQDQSLCFGAYDGEKLVAFISAYELNDSYTINNFYYLDEIDEDVKRRLVKLLLNNINKDDKSILFMSRKNEQNLFLELDFDKFAKFKKALYSGEAVAFNFSSANSKSISNENYLSVMNSIDKRAYGENRVAYAKDVLFKSSSLVLSTQVGYQHSYAINKTLVKISPWVMESSAYSDAEKMLRGIIYHRGLKRLFAFVPSGVKEITDLYASYKFNMNDEYVLLYKNKKPKINLEMLYAF